MGKKLLAMALAAALLLSGVAAWAGGAMDGLIGVFHEVNDGVTRLRVIEDGTQYDVTLDIYRLVGLEFVADDVGGVLRGTADIEGSGTAVVEVAADSAGPRVTVVDCDWALLEPGTVFTFAPGAPDIDPETFRWLFTETLTGFAGTAGASLKAANAACELLETLISCDASYCDQSAMALAIFDALSELDADTRAELDENLTGSIATLVDGAFNDDAYALGTFEDAGAGARMIEIIETHSARFDWEAFMTAYRQAR